MTLKEIANKISEEALKGRTPAKPDIFNELKYPYGVAAGFGNMACPTCGKPPTETPRGPSFLFVDYLSAKEHLISGMCQACQDDVFHE